MFYGLSIRPPYISLIDIHLCFVMCKAEMYHHPAHPDGTVVRLAQKECSRPPNPVRGGLGVIDLHFAATALADGHPLVLQLAAQDAVLCATAITPHTLYRYRLPDAAGGRVAFFGVGDPQEYRITAVCQDALFEILRQIGELCEHLLCLLRLYLVPRLSLFPTGGIQRRADNAHQVARPPVVEVVLQQFGFRLCGRNALDIGKWTAVDGFDLVREHLPAGRVLLFAQSTRPIVAAEAPNRQRGFAVVPDSHGQGLALDVPALSLPCGHRYAQLGIQRRTLRFRGVEHQFLCFFHLLAASNSA